MSGNAVNNVPGMYEYARVVLKALLPLLIGTKVPEDQREFSEDVKRIFDISETLRLSRKHAYSTSDKIFIDTLHEGILEASLDSGMQFTSKSTLLKLALLGWHFNASDVNDAYGDLRNFVRQGYNEGLWRRLHSGYQDITKLDITFEEFQSDIYVLFMYRSVRR
ncbi:unnamed protein product [Penicillium pancosmium]